MGGAIFIKNSEFMYKIAVSLIILTQNKKTSNIAYNLYDPTCGCIQLYPILKQNPVILLVNKVWIRAPYPEQKPMLGLC